MPFTVDQLTEIPAVILTPADSGMVQERHDMESRMLTVFNGLTAPAFLIIDVRNVKLSLDDVTKNANDTARERPEVLTHPNLREVVVITQDRLLALAIQGMSSPIFGGFRIKVFGTPELAMDYCRGQVAESDDQQARKKSG